MSSHPEEREPEALLFRQLERFDLEAFAAHSRSERQRIQRARLAALADHRLAHLLGSLPLHTTLIELRCAPPHRIHRGLLASVGTDFVGLISSPLHVRLVRTRGIHRYHFPDGLPPAPTRDDRSSLPDLGTYLFDHVSSGAFIEVVQYRDTRVETRSLRILAIGGDFLVTEEDLQILLLPLESFDELQLRRIDEGLDQ
ncbi:MAG: hypothetical protein ACP5PJ_09435 [Acidimicrobiales bacterium]